MIFEIEILPQDLLYFGNGMPKTNHYIYGANWPLPATFFSAMHFAMHRLYPHLKSDALNGLNTVGVFPKKEGKIFMPMPNDVVGGYGLNPLIKTIGSNSLPKPLKYLMYANKELSKTRAKEWIALEDLERYFKGESIVGIDSCELYDVEKRVGIGIDNKTMTTIDKAFYVAEYMRLKSDVSMVGFVWLESNRELLENFLKDSYKRFTFGGQRGVVNLHNYRAGKLPFVQTDCDSKLVKYVTLSPSYSHQGWLPGFVDSQTGKVLLKERIERGDMDRKTWRQKMQKAPLIDAKLVAASVGKALPITGWDLRSQAPESTKLAIPAGSIYCFEASSVEEAQKLRHILNGAGRSDEFGTQGFGLGICGSFKYNQTI